MGHNDCSQKIDTDDVKQVIKKITWRSGTTYDMYRHDVKAESPSKPSNAISLYEANYYVMNSTIEFTFAYKMEQVLRIQVVEHLLMNLLLQI